MLKGNSLQHYNKANKISNWNGEEFIILIHTQWNKLMEPKQQTSNNTTNLLWKKETNWTAKHNRCEYCNLRDRHTCSFMHKEKKKFVQAIYNDNKQNNNKNFPFSFQRRHTLIQPKLAAMQEKFTPPEKRSK